MVEKISNCFSQLKRKKLAELDLKVHIIGEIKGKSFGSKLKVGDSIQTLTGGFDHFKNVEFLRV